MDTDLKNLIRDISNVMILKSPKKLEDPERLLVFEECCLALGDLSFDQLKVGRIKYARMQNSFGIDTGKFRDLCLSVKPAKQYISQSDPDDIPLCNRDLNGKSCRMIIEKLKLPEVLKKKEFGDFKKNRHIIEATRKAKLLKGKNAAI